jgi:ATP-binding cassette subfamily B protein
VLTSVQIVQAYTAEQHEDARFREMNKRSLRAGVRLTRIEAQLNRAVQIAVAVGVCAILWFGTQDVTARRLSPGQLLVFLAYLRGLYRPLRQASKLTQRMAKAAACGHRVLEVLDEEPQIQDPPKAVSLRRVRGQITFRDVSFSYRPGEPVLRNVSLEISPHEMVAVVGPTGAGKSTLLSLIPRFYDPQGGQMLIDGTPIATVRLQSLRRHISFLPQEALVMGISIRENIAYGAIGRRGAPPDENEIERAARKAHAHEFIVDLPNGYDTVVGERGATLSGGQRQRIAIARAIVRRAPILLMDEPMAGLDPVSATAVLEALDEVTPKRTALVVAHHLSTVLHATRVVFLDDGEIVEQGTHDNLLARGGRYAEFFHTEWSNMAARVDDTAWAVPPDPSAKR